MMTAWFQYLTRTALIGFFSLACLIPSNSNGSEVLEAGSGWITQLNGPLDDYTGIHLLSTIDRANQEEVAFLVIEIDTPGGRIDVLRELVQKILGSSVPIISYVSPKGASATSAGTYILLASHIAAMAPTTNVGSATPVLIDGTEPSPDMRNKMVNDAAAYIRGIANERNRNASWAERSVRTAENVTASEALELEVIDFVAQDISELLEQSSDTTVNLNGIQTKLNFSNTDLIQQSNSFDLDYAVIWIVTGAILVLAEFMVSGFIVLFFGVAAIVTGLAISLGVPGEGGIPYTIFVLVSLALLLFARKQMKRWFQGDVVGSQQNEIDKEFIGEIVEIISGFDPDSPGYGIVSYRGSHWNAKSDTSFHTQGTRVSVIGRSSTTLIV